MRINSVPDVKCFCNNKKVLRAQLQWYDISCATLYQAQGGLSFCVSVRVCVCVQIRILQKTVDCIIFRTGTINCLF